MDAPTLEQSLFRWFGFTEFREAQKEIIESILYHNRDVSCIMATGHGKSICYQLPPLITNKPSIVISPLLSLMHDQMSNLQKKGISACCYTPSLMYGDQVKSDILSGNYKIIYTTPETLIKDINIFLELSPGLIAIDEAHCISLWGNSFRPSYTELSRLKILFPTTAILALTGTATEKVELDIIKSLQLKDPLRIRTNPDRPNIKYFVHKKSGILTDLLPLIQDNIIIYCPTRNETESLENSLRGYVSVRAYHAGMSQSKRTLIHNEFMNGTVTCIIATICFGMGIDKSNIRKVIHYGCPRDLESYYQEIGRAGRDGLSSECHVFFSESDFIRNYSFLKEITDPVIKQYRESMISAMEKFLYLTTCRRQYLLSHFHGVYTTNPNCCDNCFTPIHNIDIGPEVGYILGLLNDYSRLGGKTMYINVLRGSNLKKIPDYVKQSAYFGIGKTKTVDWWKICIQHLCNESLIEQKLLSGGYGYVINISSTGILRLRNRINSYIINNNIFSNLSQQLAQSLPIPTNNHPSPVCNQSPLQLKLTVSNESPTNNHPSPVCNQSLPVNNPTLENNQSLPVNNQPLRLVINHSSSPIINKSTSNVVETKLTNTVNATYNLFQNEKKELKDIANIRGLKPATIETHIADCVRANVNIDYNRLPLTVKDYDVIMTVIDNLQGDISKLAPIKAACDSSISYYQIKCALLLKKITTVVNCENINTNYLCINS